MERTRRTWAAGVVLATAALVGCAGGPSESAPDEGEEGAGGPVPGALQVEVRTDRQTYDAGATPELTLTVRNTGDAPVTLAFTSGQRYDFRVEDASGRSVWTWSATRSFMQVLGEETIPAGESLEWTETVEPSLEPGEYTAVGMVTSRDGPLVDRTGLTVR